MKQILGSSLCFAVALTLTGPARGGNGQSASLTILANGRITIVDDTARSKVTTAEKIRKTPCASLGNLAPSSTEVRIQTDAGASYGVFLRAANWLAGCDVRGLRLASPTASGRLPHDDDARLQMNTGPRMPPPPLLCMRTWDGQVICPPEPKGPTIVSFAGDGSIFVSMDARMKKSTADSLATDIAADLRSTHPTDELVYVRADQKLAYARFVEALTLLNLNGYSRLALINEAIDSERRLDMSGKWLSEPKP